MFLDRPPELPKPSRSDFAIFRGSLEGIEPELLLKRYSNGAATLLPGSADKKVLKIRNQVVQIGRGIGVRESALRLLEVAPERLKAPANISLEEFQRERDPDGYYTESELIELYTEEVDSAGDPRVAARNNRLRRRQLDIASHIEAFSTRPVTAPVLADWFIPQFVARFAICKLHSVADLASFIERHGSQWFRKIHRVGPGRARLIIAWLRGFDIGGKFALERAPVNPLHVSRTEAELRIAPLESFTPPSFATQGHERLVKFLEELRATAPTSTFLAYRREAERFHLFCCLELGISFTEAAPVHFERYRVFLSSLGLTSMNEWHYQTSQQEWIGPRHAERASLGWKPFAGPLKPASLQRALDGARTVIRRLNNSKPIDKIGI